MRKLLVVALSVAAAVALTVPALAATRTVRVGDNWFVSSTAKGTPTVNVKRNDTVRWRFVGDSPHNVVVSSGPVKFRSPVRRSGSYRRKMTRRGTYRIFCEIHGARDQSMRLRVR